MRIAVVNDMALAAEVLRRIVKQSGHEVAWTAADGAEAVARCRGDRPDLILMDLVMPNMDGTEATCRIMREAPCAILIVTASVAGNAAKVFEAMGYGALDAVRTPTLAGLGKLAGAELLCQKIENVARMLNRNCATPAIVPLSEGPFPPPPMPQFLAIGASTGGPQAIAELLAALPLGFPAAVLVTQHVDAEFARGLAEWFGRRSRLPVAPAEGGEMPQPGHVYVAAKADHLVLSSSGRLAYTADPADCVYRPSVDVLFRSLAAHAASPGVALLLTGMGRDGASGLLELRQRGWHTIAQGPQTCVVYGMPRAAVDAGAAVDALELPAIAPAVLRRFERHV